MSISKLANLLFTYELDRRLCLPGVPTIALASHPGVVYTDLFRTRSRLARFVISPRMRVLNFWFAQSVRMGALPALRAATDPSARGGEFYGPRRRLDTGYPARVESSARSHEAQDQARLWAMSERLFAVRACEVFYREILREISLAGEPADRLAAIARCYVRFAGFNRPLFEVLFTGRIDKRGHPEVEEAERPLDDTLLECVRAVSGEDPSSSDDLATAAEAAAHGHAMMLLDGDFGVGDAAIEEAAQRAAAATLALIEGRRLLSRRSEPKP